MYTFSFLWKVIRKSDIWKKSWNAYVPGTTVLLSTDSPFRTLTPTKGSEEKKEDERDEENPKKKQETKEKENEKKDEPENEENTNKKAEDTEKLKIKLTSREKDTVVRQT